MKSVCVCVCDNEDVRTTIILHITLIYSLKVYNLAFFFRVQFNSTEISRTLSSIDENWKYQHNN